MKIILAIGAGSFIGGILRYTLSLFIQTKFLASFPFGTLTVNIIGCFLIGLLSGIGEKGIASETWKLFLTTGLLGGFTTFSAFSHESVSMFQNGQTGHAFIYIFSSIILGLFATFAGIAIMK